MTGAEIIDGFTRIAGVLSLLSAYKIGGGWTRTRQRITRTAFPGLRRARALSRRGASCRPGLVNGGKRHGGRVRAGIAVLWLALLLSILVYVEVHGASALADLEALGFGAVMP